MPGGIAGERRIVEDSLRRFAAVEKNPAIHVVQLAVHGDLVFRVLHFHAVGHAHHIGHAGRETPGVRIEFIRSSHARLPNDFPFGQVLRRQLRRVFRPARTSIEHQYRSRRRQGPAAIPRGRWRYRGRLSPRCAAASRLAKRVDRRVHTGEVRRGRPLRAQRCHRYEQQAQERRRKHSNGLRHDVSPHL